MDIIIILGLIIVDHFLTMLRIEKLEEYNRHHEIEHLTIKDEMKKLKKKSK